jgi:oligoendopeptidase F
MAKTSAHTRIKTNWDLKQLYTTPHDPQIEKDIVYTEKAYTAFAKKYQKDNSYVTDEKALARAMQDYVALIDIPESKAYVYLKLSQDLDGQNQTVRAQMNLLSQRLVTLSNIILFFELNLAKIDKTMQKRMLASNLLVDYRYFLKKIFEASKYVLSEPEEKILSLTSLTSRGMWVDSLKKMKSKQTILYKGKKIPLAEAESLIRELPKQTDRIELFNKTTDVYYQLGDLAESELNAIVTSKKISDELRGHAEPYDGTILSYENDKKSVLNLVDTVTRSFVVSQRFYKIKARMLGVKKLTYADRAAGVGSLKKKISFKQAYETLSDIFYSLDPQFGDILKRFVENGQIDVYPKVGKAGGAYCWGNHKLPTFVLLNHTDTLDSLQTFAHEMGHAIHTELSKNQPVLYEGYSISTAEVASTLFEAFVFYNQFEKLSDTEKIVALHDKIQDDIQTIFRQIAVFNFEVEMHKTIREKGSMSKEELAHCMNTHMKSYMGNIDLKEKDGYFFVVWPHIRNFFYVYSYAFGQLASKALYAKYVEDPTYIEKIKKFLSLGGALSPEDIFASIGVDVRKPDFFEKGIQLIENDIQTLEKLVAQQKKK